MKRWIIRSFFITLLLLCVGGWAWSAGHWLQIAWYPWGHEFGGGFNSGTVDLAFSTSRSTQSSTWDCGPLDKIYLLPEYFGGSNHEYFGFGFNRNPGQDGCRYWFRVPYWFLVALFSFSLLFVWRKTRPKINPAKAFPVDAISTTKH